MQKKENRQESNPAIKKDLTALSKAIQHTDQQLDKFNDALLMRDLDLLGAQNALGGGGRYDDLVRQMGGADVPAIGFAIGLERVLMAQGAGGSSASAGDEEGLCAFVATVSPAQIPHALELVEFLRGKGLAAMANLEERPLKRQFEQASKLVPRGYVFVLGEEEVAKGAVTVKEMATGKQKKVSRSDLFQECFGKITPCDEGDPVG